MAGNSKNTSGNGRGAAGDREDVLRRAGIQRSFSDESKAGSAKKSTDGGSGGNARPSNSGSQQKKAPQNRSQSSGKKPSGSGAKSGSGKNASKTSSQSRNKQQSASNGKGGAKSQPKNNQNTSRSKNASNNDRNVSGSKNASKNSSQNRSGANSAQNRKNTASQKKSAPVGNTGKTKNSAEQAKKKPISQSGKNIRNDSSRNRLAAVSPEVDTRNRKEMQERAEKRKLEQEKRRKEEEKINRARVMQKYRKLFTGLRYFAIFAVIIGLLVLLSVTVLFKVEKIAVVKKDEVSYSDAEIVSLSEIKLDESLFLADTEKAQSSIAKSLPFIGECTVERKLPTKIIITVKSAHKLGLVSGADVTALIDDGGKVLRYVDASEDKSKYVVLNGLDGQFAQPGETMKFSQPDRVKTAAVIVGRLEERGIKPDSVDIAENSLSFMYDSRVKVRLGTSVGLEKKLELAAAIFLEGRIQDYEKGILDMTIEGRGDFLPDYVVEQFGLDGPHEPPETTPTDDVSPADVQPAADTAPVSEPEQTSPDAGTAQT